ncbi:MAG: hypothetical protein RBT81_13150, partial [Gammaproteobacteria bacterium]|nr:hypothetical protein [Gammaproteobacteria bacterium]
MFSISFEPRAPRSPKRLAVGTITIGAFTERFEAPLDYWTCKAYEAHWREAVRRIVIGRRRSALITSMLDPAN